jgi:hypothetical protein
MANHNLTGELALREAFDLTTGALKTIPSAATTFSIELDSADGDNVTAKPDIGLISDTTETNAIGMKSICLFIEPGVAASVKAQVSPTDSGDVWMDVPSGLIANDLSLVSATSVLTICARRIRIIEVSGTPIYHLVMQSV